MKELRIFRLIMRLSVEENEYLVSILKDKKHKLFLSLFNAIVQTKSVQYTREELFLRIYKKKWTLKHDAAFRTDLSRLADFIENYLIEERLKKRIKTDLKLVEEERLNLYLDLKLTKELEQQYAQLLIQYSYDASFQNTLTEKYGNFVIKTANSLQERNNLMQNVYKNYASQSHQQNAILNAKSFYFNCLQNYYYKQLNGSYLEEITFEKYAALIENEPIIEAKYYYLLGISNLRLDVSSSDDELIYYHLLEETAIQLLKLSAKFQPQFARAYHIIATRYSIIGNFEKANIYYRELIDKIPPKQLADYAISILNYITNLSKLKQFDEALQYLKLLEKDIKNDAKLKSDYNIRLLSCHLFMNNANEILMIIAKEDYNTLQPFEKIYYRLCQCNAYIIQNEFELAYNEINNLIRSKLMQEMDADYLPVTELISFLLACIFKNGKSKLTPAQLKQFDTLRKQHETVQFPYLKHYSPYLWLKQQLAVA